MDHNFLLTQSTTNFGCFNGLGPLSNGLCSTSTGAGQAPTMFTKMLSTIIGIMTVVAFIWFIFILFTGAVSWLGSGGDKIKLQEAQKRITNGVIGLVLVIISIFVIKLMGTIIGIDILDIANLISNL